jgi:SAM-dependent methyltransferase
MNKEFWDQKYSTNTASCKGSVGKYRSWKWSIIENYIDSKDMQVLDVGCGDIRFLKGKEFKEYIGVDISPTAIRDNRKKRGNLRFWCLDVTKQEINPLFTMMIADTNMILCMDVLFHIVDEIDFRQLLTNLNKWANDWLFINTWVRNPLPYLFDNYQYYRDLMDYLVFMPNLELIAIHQRQDDIYNALYVFRRKID